jgi:hypothetical protein
VLELYGFIIFIMANNIKRTEVNVVVMTKREGR